MTLKPFSSINLSLLYKDALASQISKVSKFNYLNVKGASNIKLTVSIIISKSLNYFVVDSRNWILINFLLVHVLLVGIVLYVYVFSRSVDNIHVSVRIFFEINNMTRILSKCIEANHDMINRMPWINHIFWGSTVVFFLALLIKSCG